MFYFISGMNYILKPRMNEFMQKQAYQKLYIKLNMAPGKNIFGSSAVHGKMFLGSMNFKRCQKPNG